MRSVSVYCVLVLLAMPSLAANAPPLSEPVDAIVVNDASNPLPVTIQTDPVPVSIQGDSVPVTVEANKLVLWRLVGVSTHVDQGDFHYGGLSGPSALHAACADTFPGSGARAASIAEAYAGGVYPVEGFAWLAPSGPMVAYPAGEGWRANDAASGVVVGIETVVSQSRAIQAAYCNSFQGSSTADMTAVVSFDGRVFTQNCNWTVPVACAAPTVIEIP